MTPLIQEAIEEVLNNNPLFPVERLKWFDTAALTTFELENFRSINPKTMSNPLPFERVSIVTKDTAGNRTIIMVSSDHANPELGGVAVEAWVRYLEGDYVVKLHPVIFHILDDLDSGVGLTFLDNKTGKPMTNEEADKLKDEERSCVTTALKYVEVFLGSIQTERLTYYEPIKRKNHAKRIRQGKKPMFDWRTVVIEPTKPKAEPQGGTHASPRQHDRRGHWRFIKKTQKRVWVKNCRVGKASNGIVFQDYKVKGETV